MDLSLSRRSALKLLSGTALLHLPVAGALARTTDPAVIAVTGGREIALVPATFGTSGGDNLAKYTGDPRFMAALGKLAPSIFRYPGGNGANWFDIATGVYVEKPVVARSANTSRFDTPFTFGVLKEILQQAHAEPSLVLNLLTGDMETQIGALKAAKASGISVQRIELGNEYYLRGAAAGTTAYLQVFPTAADYARVALKYAKALRDAFPECQIAVPILARDSNGARERAWNEDLLKHIDTSIDGVIAHIYRRLPASQFGANLPSNPLAAPGGPQMLFAAALEPHPLDVVRATVHSVSRRIWVTETNISDPGHWSAYTWAHGLALAVNLMNMLTMPRVEQVLCWSLLGDPTFSLMTSPQKKSGASGIDPASLTANGFACMLLFRAARGKTTARPLEFASAELQTSSGNTVPSLYGWQYGPDSALILNLSQSQQTVQLKDSQLSKTSFYQLAADATQVVRDESSFAVARGKSSGPVALPPYSMTHFFGE